MRGIKVVGESFGRFSDLIDYLGKMSNKEDYNIIDYKIFKSERPTILYNIVIRYKERGVL
ncbi:MAG: hypothetical protein ACI4VU_06835 [Methanobrevibacter sp.]